LSCRCGGIAIAHAPPEDAEPNGMPKLLTGGQTMSIFKKIMSAILFVSLLALAGCPEMANQTGGSSGSSDSSGSSAD